jgi:hypothetical protein
LGLGPSWEGKKKKKKGRRCWMTIICWVMFLAGPNSFGFGCSKIHQRRVLFPAEPISIGSSRTQQFVSRCWTQSLLDLAWPLNPIHLKDFLFFFYIFLYI